MSLSFYPHTSHRQHNLEILLINTMLNSLIINILQKHKITKKYNYTKMLVLESPLNKGQMEITYGLEIIQYCLILFRLYLCNDK